MVRNINIFDVLEGKHEGYKVICETLSKDEIKQIFEEEKFLKDAAEEFFNNPRWEGIESKVMHLVHIGANIELYKNYNEEIKKLVDSQTDEIDELSKALIHGIDIIEEYNELKTSMKKEMKKEMKKDFPELLGKLKDEGIEFTKEELKENLKDIEKTISEDDIKARALFPIFKDICEEILEELFE